MPPPIDEDGIIWSNLKTLQDDYHDFNTSFISSTPLPTAVEFAKIVAKGQPVVFDVPAGSDSSMKAGLPWRACSWTAADLDSKVKKPVEVALTPFGNADALVDVCNGEQVQSLNGGNRVFVQPATQEMSMSELLHTLTAESGLGNGPRAPVRYLQSQNSNLDTQALSPFREDLPDNFDFAEEVLGEPDARNIWIGNHRSVTSVHRDPYENLYLVIRGSKTFRLWAPVDEVTMPTKMVSTGRYEYTESGNGGRFEVVKDEAADVIPWVDIDPLSPNFEDPGSMRCVTVNHGQMLYLPAGYYHHVTQECGRWDDGSVAPCIAVNYWYDLDYEGEKYVMRQLIGRLVASIKQQRAP